MDEIPWYEKDREKTTKEIYARADRRAAFWSGFLTAIAIIGTVFAILFASGE